MTDQSPIVPPTIAELQSAQLDLARVAHKLENGDRINALIGHFANAEKPEDFNAPPLKITPVQRSYAALRVRGFSASYACSKLHQNRTRVTYWEEEEWFQLACEQERSSWLVGAGIDEKQEILVPLVPDTIKAIKNALHSEDENIQLKAAQFVLDNIFGSEKKSVGRPKKQADEDAMPDLSDILGAADNKILNARTRSTDSSATSIISSEQMTQDYEDRLAIRIKTGDLPKAFSDAFPSAK